MNKKTYIQYLETIVLSLLKERHIESDIVAVSELPSYKGYTFSPVNVRASIEEHHELFSSAKNVDINVGEVRAIQVAIKVMSRLTEKIENGASLDLETTPHFCVGCGRYELHKMCPAHGTKYYMSGKLFTAEMEELCKELYQWKRYASYCNSCAKSGEYNVIEFQEFCDIRMRWLLKKDRP